MYQFRNQGIVFRALHVDYGQPSALLEWQCVQDVAKQLSVAADQVRLAGKFDFRIGEIPGRNAALIFIALMHLQLSERLLCIGIHAGTSFFDCSLSFFLTTSRLVAEQTDSRVRLIAPLLNFTKSEIVSLAKQTAVPLSSTYSCQLGVREGCGACHSCLDRKALGC